MVIAACTRLAGRTLLLVGLLLAARPAAPAGEVEDGLWVASPDDRGRPLTIEGRVVVLEGPYTPPVREATLVSEDNANRAFRLQVTVAAESETLAERTKVLVLGPFAARAASWGRASDATSHLGFRLPDGPAVAAAEQLFGIRARRRRHPHHALQVAFTVPATGFVQGQPMPVTLQLVNVGEGPVAFDQGGLQRGARDNQFGFTAEGGPGGRAVPDTGDPTHFGGISRLVRLEPGAVHSQEVDLRGWFDLAPGTYALMGTYRLTLHAPDASGWTSPLWEDVAAAPFVATVAARMPAAPGAEAGGPAEDASGTR